MLQRLLLACGLSLACTGQEFRLDEGGESTPATSESSGADPETTESESSSTESGVPDLPQAPDCGEECDIWDPGACPLGEKCTAVRCDVGGNYWDSNTCRAIQGDGVHGDPCQLNHGYSFSGNDTCAAGHMCWYVDWATGTGTCAQFCEPPVTDPGCPEGSHCLINSNGVTPVCLFDCDPFEPDCPVGHLCAPSPTPGYSCVLNASGGAAPYGTPCSYANACNPGLICIDPAAVPEPACTGASGCCSPYCPLNQPNDCPGAGQTCEPVFDPQPPGYEEVGVCKLVD